MSIPPGTDTEKSSIGGVPLLNGIAQYCCFVNAALLTIQVPRRARKALGRCKPYAV